MLSNSKWVKVAYLNQNIELNILSYISFLHYKSQKNKIFEVVFPRKVLNQRIHFDVLMLKSSFTSLVAITKGQKYNKSETLHEIGEVLRYAKDLMARLKADLQSNIQFAQINVY